MRELLRLRHTTAFISTVVLVPALCGCILPSETVPSFDPIPLTSLPQSERVPALSPTGDRVAFAWNPGGGADYDIHVMPVSGGEPLQLTHSDGRFSEDVKELVETVISDSW